MIETLLQLARQIDSALKENISPIAKIFVIFCVWFLGAVIIIALAVAGSYTTAWLTFVSIFAFIMWLVVCIIMAGMAIKDDF